MKDAHKGFVGQSLHWKYLPGVQEHSAGSDFPVTHYCVGGFPSGRGGSYWVIQHPCGTKRRSWSIGMRDATIAAFKEADEAIHGLDCRLVSERIAFELALDALDRKGRLIGFSLPSKGE